MKKLRMNLAENSYDILLGHNLLSEIDRFLDLDRKVLIVTDTGVPEIYADIICQKCKEFKVFRFKMGELSKNLDTWQEGLKMATDFKMTRKDVVLALGGGVVGDLAGFIAASYMRGIDFYNVPTTTLSQIDSSIGGKVAVDFYGMKNIVGAFHQPKKVIVDIDTLKTLDDIQVNNGLAEAIKTGLIGDKELFELFEEVDAREKLDEVIYKCLEFKKMVVEEDEKELGLRKILNFGHTIGHAIETYSNGDLLHGECVAIGMMKIIEDEEIKNRLLKVLTKYDLPIDADYKKDEVFEIMSHDKKSGNGTIDVVKLSKIGEAYVNKTNIEDLKRYL